MKFFGNSLLFVFEPNLKKCQELLLRLPNKFGSFSFVVHHLTIFDHLIQRGFGVFAKIKVSNIINLFCDVMIIPLINFLISL